MRCVSDERESGSERRPPQNECRGLALSTKHRGRSHTIEPTERGNRFLPASMRETIESLVTTVSEK